MNEPITPLPFCSGTGNEASPYVSDDGSAGINPALARLAERGGLLRLPNARYDITSPITLNTPSTRISGDVWGYSSDPNGVFESAFGTKIRLGDMSIPAIRIGHDRTLGGNVVSDLGVQGNLVGMDTRPLFDISHPEHGAGLVFDSVRTDQCEFDKLSFCGLGTAIAAIGNAELDACCFGRCNTDGCAVGIYFSPRASYYSRIHRNIFADNPYYAILVDGRGKFIHTLEITENSFVRNGGGFDGRLPTPAVVTLLDAHSFRIERNHFDDPGTFWYYEPTATKNEERRPQKQAIPALLVNGDGNLIRDNIFSRSKGPAVIVEGNGNVLMNNVTDGDIYISGSRNSIFNVAFTKPEARLVLSADACDSEIHGVAEERIVRQA